MKKRKTIKMIIIFLTDCSEEGIVDHKDLSDKTHKLFRNKPTISACGKPSPTEVTFCTAIQDMF